MPKRSPARRLVRTAGFVAGGLVLVVAGLVLAAWLFLRASLPQLDGTLAYAGLAQAVQVSRDAAGSTTIRAADRGDLAFATGFAHAQDRYFQMDLLRRVAAGELAALVGPAALPVDREHRLHRMRARALAAYASLPAAHRALLERYAAGVNAGLARLGARPFEYALLKTAPQAWQPVDTLLVVDAMYFDLQSAELSRVLSRGALRESLPADLQAVLMLDASHWDAPLDGQPMGAAPVRVPATRPDWLDTPAPLRTSDAFVPRASAVGSNALAVDGRHGAGGRASVANDMHLGLRLPNTWYRLTLEFPDPAGGTRRVSGLSLPGAPVVVAGSNGDVAWGFTNSYGHFIDLVELELDPSDARRYRAPSGQWEQAVEHTETIAVNGGVAESLTVRDTRWGPMMEARGRRYAVRWVAYLPDAADLGLIGMETARNLEQALLVAQRSGVPTQNIVVADRQGRIGWTLAGPLPAAMLDPQGFPVPASAAGAALERLPAAAYPRRVDPRSGRLWTGNGTQLADTAEQRKIGDGGSDVGARGQQMRDALLAGQTFDERGLLAIQLDDRARWIEPWRALALQVLDDAALQGHPRRAEFRRIVRQWNGRADAQAAGYTLVRAFHRTLYERWFGGLDARLAAQGPGLSLRAASARALPLMEALAREQAWVPAKAGNWRNFMLESLDAAIDGVASGGTALAEARWGEYNRLAVAHPFARLVPGPLRRLLAAPAEPMPGDINMPRVQGRSFGASERFAVSPGREEAGVLHTPGGASGHPLSPYFLAGHEAWVRGEPAPFLPGPAAHRLTLAPPAAKASR